MDHESGGSRWWDQIDDLGDVLSKRESNARKVGLKTCRTEAPKNGLQRIFAKQSREEG
jgi:hypothetical protein